KAERPSKQRRLTSLPSVAPTARPAGSTTMTTSGSGLFQVESERTPTSSPQPTDDNTGDLVKTSASGPMATSRYCDHRPSEINASFSLAEASEPGLTERISAPTRSARASRIDCALA